MLQSLAGKLAQIKILKGHRKNIDKPKEIFIFDC